MTESKPYTTEAVDLLHRGTLALAEVEVNGLCVDVPYVEQAIKTTRKRVGKIRERLQETDLAKEWRKRFQNKTNFESNAQLGFILFNVMKYPHAGYTDTGKFKTDEEAISTVNHPFVADFIKMGKLQRAADTFLSGILRETVNGRAHCFYNLNIARTFRSSCSDFNFTNVPARDPEVSTLVRQAIVPRKGNHVVEIDFSGAEVRVSCAYHKDKSLISYVLNPTKDMHRDSAMELYKLPLSEFIDHNGEAVKTGKPIRHAAKNMFVFPQFYGSYFIQCAPNLWAEAEKLKLADGTPLKKHLEQQGITALGTLDPKTEPAPGTFEASVKVAERSMWDDRFPDYQQWKWDHYAEYQSRGWLKTLTGFVCQGYMGRNDVSNYPIQGSSFHCLLWVLIVLVMEELKKRGMKTLITGQIHDSIVADVPSGELDDYIVICQELITKRLQQHYPWLVVPMEAEVGVAPLGMSWADKKEYKL